MRSLLLPSLLILTTLGGCDAAKDAHGSATDYLVDSGATEQIKVYEIAKKNGAKLEACTQAMAIAALFLQAKNEDAWKEWKAKEKEDCESAGMPVS